MANKKGCFGEGMLPVSEKVKLWKGSKVSCCPMQRTKTENEILDLQLPLNHIRQESRATAGNLVPRYVLV